MGISDRVTEIFERCSDLAGMLRDKQSECIELERKNGQLSELVENLVKSKDHFEDQVNMCNISSMFYLK